MRFLLTVLLIGAFCNSQSLVAQEPEHNAKRAEQNTNAAKQGTEKNPLFVKVVPTGNGGTDIPKKEVSENHKSENEVRIANATIALVWITGVLAFFTALLWLATVNLAKDAKRTSERQSAETEKSLSISKQAAIAAKASADAALKSSMPVLFPSITGMDQLHPLTESNTAITHDANIFIQFDNYGKTPGIIRQVRADLYLTDRDRLPKVDFENLTIRKYYVMVPGNTLGKDQMTGALDLKQTITFSPIELTELLSEARDKFRRFVLIGQVIYDDFFGLRHTSRFCVKLRMWTVLAVGNIPVINYFQIAHGGSAYNRIESKEIPKPDPLETGIS